MVWRGPIKTLWAQTFKEREREREKRGSPLIRVRGPTGSLCQPVSVSPVSLTDIVLKSTRGLQVQDFPKSTLTADVKAEVRCKYRFANYFQSTCSTTGCFYNRCQYLCMLSIVSCFALRKCARSHPILCHLSMNTDGSGHCLQRKLLAAVNSSYNTQI